MSKLSDFACYVEERIDNKNLTRETYISVDNLIPNRGGVTYSNYLPLKGTSISFKKGDILIGNIRPYFKKIWLAQYDGGCSADVLCIRPVSKEITKYLYVCLSQDYFFVYNMTGSKGSKMPRGDKNHIMNFPIKLPKNFNKIGDLFLNIENQIKRNNKMVQKLQVLAQSIYCKNISNSTFTKLSSVSTILNGKEDANHSITDGKYKFFTCSNNILLCNDYKFEGKSILVAGNGNFNVKFYDGKFNAYQRTYVIKNDRIIGNLYYTLLFNVELFKKKANGSIIKFITINILNKINVPIFTNETNTLLNKILLQINTINESTERLIHLKKVLLPLLINQQLI